MPNTPIVNAGEKYINGLNLTRDSDEEIVIAAGRCRDSSNVNDIIVDSALTVSNIVAGANGLDTGSVANSTHYAVYVIGDSTGYKATAGILSVDYTSPALPSGYDMWRRVGSWLTSATADWVAQFQVGEGPDRWMWYDGAVATDITAGASATYVTVDCSGGLPPLGVPSILKINYSYTPTGTNDALNLVPGDSIATVGYAVATGTGAGAAGVLECICIDNPVGAVNYKVNGSATALDVRAYLDVLA